MRLYVGNFPYETTEGDLENWFEDFGHVKAVQIITDRDTGKSKGFGFVELVDRDALAAIEGLNGLKFGGRELRVSEARPREERSGGGGDRRPDRREQRRRY